MLDGTNARAMETHSRARISVIVPVHNGGDALGRCLRALASAVPPAHEVVVVPDGESDGAWRGAERYGARVLAPGAGPRGPAHARNRGAAAANGDILFFVDADVAAHAGAMAIVAGALHGDPALDAVIGSYDDAPGDPAFLSQYRNLLHHYTHQHARQDAMTFWGACGAIRREVFLDVGGFDEGYTRPSVEDIELGYRLRRAGRRIALVRDLQVTHLKAWTAVDMVRTDFLRRALPWTALLLRERRFDSDLNIDGRNRLSVALALSLVATLALAVAWPALVGVAAIMGQLLLLVNARLYRFFAAKRGSIFALRAIPWHWLHYLSSGLAFIVGVVRHVAAPAPAGGPARTLAPQAQ